MVDLLTLKLALFYLVKPFLNRRKPPKKWERAGTCLEYELYEKEGKVLLKFKGGSLIIQALTPFIFKVLFETRCDPDHISYSVVYKKNVRLSVKSTEKNLAIKEESGKGLKVNVDLSTTTLTFSLRDIILHTEADSPGWQNGWVSCMKSSPEQEKYLGFGQKTGPLYKNGRKIVMWNTDEDSMGRNSDPIYQSCPFFIGLRENGFAHGIFFDNPHYSQFRMSKEVKEGPNSNFYTAEGGPLCYYVLGGPLLKDVINQYALLTGTYNLPPRWVLGHHHSRWDNNETGDAIRKLAEDFRTYKIPCDVLHIDIGHLDGFRCFTWNKERFVQPKKLIEDLHKKGFKTVVIVDPGIKQDEEWDIFKEGKDKDFFCKDKDEKLYIGPVWPGSSAFVDFTYPPACEFWGKLYSHYLDMGIDGFWNDMNEPSIFTPLRTMPSKVVHRGASGNMEIGHKRIHNLYGLLMARASFNGITKLKKDKRFFLFCRSSFAGIQRFASTWTGDNKSNWTHLRLSIPMILNMGLSGQVMTGPDMGGFWGNPKPDLLIRWIQIGAFYPFCRNHTRQGTKPQEIWRFGEKVLQICKKYLNLRYRLLPYLYTWLKEGCDKGYPLMRPVFLEFPTDKKCQEEWISETEFLCGPSILVAPVLWPKKSSRKVYLPENSMWYDFWTFKLYEGGKIYDIGAPIERMPIFVKAGSVIPMSKAALVTSDSVENELIIFVYPYKEIEGRIYLDDGKSFMYKDGYYSKIKITGKSEPLKDTFKIERSEGELEPIFYKHKEILFQMALCGRQEKIEKIIVNGILITGENGNHIWKIEDNILNIRGIKGNLPISIRIDYLKVMHI